MNLSMQQAYKVILLALCIWREAQNQTRDAQLAVGCTIRNRVKQPRWWGHDWESVILCDKQYSSFNHGDVNATKMPAGAAPAWEQCCEVAQEIYEELRADFTGGCTHYYDRSLDATPPSWAKDMLHVCNVGDFRFYK